MRNYLIIEKDSKSVRSIKNVLEDYKEFNCIGISTTNTNAMNIILKENQFSQNLMNSIGVDFKLKNLDLDGTRFKLQIVRNNKCN